MKTERYIVLFLFFVQLSTQPLFTQSKSFNFNKVTKIAKKLVKQKKVPGLAISIAKNSKIVYSHGFGYANIKTKKKIEPNYTLFRIGSISKSITALALAKMVEQQIINLDTSFYHYVTYFPKKKYDFNLRQLGGHLAGIRSYKNDEFFINKKMSTKEGIEIFESDSLLYKPGTKYFYSSYGINLLALAMEEVAHQTIETYIHGEVLSPLSLKNIIPDKNQDLKNRALPYRKKRKKRFTTTRYVDNYYKLASGGYIGTSEDITKLGIHLLNNSWINQEILKPFITSQKINDKKTYYGIGFQTSYDHNNRAYFGHVGSALGGYALFYVYPKEQIVFVLLMNCTNPKQDKQLNKLISKVFIALK